jgi:hypothetical protein
MGGNCLIEAANTSPYAQGRLMQERFSEASHCVDRSERRKP